MPRCFILKLRTSWVVVLLLVLVTICFINLAVWNHGLTIERINRIGLISKNRQDDSDDSFNADFLKARTGNKRKLSEEIETGMTPGFEPGTAIKGEERVERGHSSSLKDLFGISPRFVGTSLVPPNSTLSLHERIQAFFPEHKLVTTKRTYKDLQQNVRVTNRTCDKFPSTLQGQRNISADVTLENIFNETVLGNVQPGGLYKPVSCEPRDHVAIIVPYRDRAEHLEIFLMHMHALLQRQQLAYAIYVVELALPTQFNRGLLANVGFLTAKSIKQYSCYVIHDVDLLPVDDRNIYTCSKNPRHLSVANSKFKYSLPYGDYVGGVMAFTPGQFEAVNGFSNLYFGWGAEDDDIRTRVTKCGYTIDRPLPSIGIYRALYHEADSSNPHNPHKDALFKNAAGRFRTEGLNSVKYVRQSLEFRPLYTWIYSLTSEKEILKSYKNEMGMASKPPIKRNYGNFGSFNNHQKKPRSSPEEGSQKPSLIKDLQKKKTFLNESPGKSLVTANAPEAAIKPEEVRAKIENKARQEYVQRIKKQFEANRHLVNKGI